MREDVESAHTAHIVLFLLYFLPTPCPHSAHACPHAGAANARQSEVGLAF